MAGITFSGIRMPAAPWRFARCWGDASWSAMVPRSARVVALGLLIGVLGSAGLSGGAEARTKEICQGLGERIANVCARASRYCSDVRKCRKVVSFLQEKGCFSARNSEAGCNETLNTCLKNPGVQVTRETLREHRRRLACANYEWDVDRCRNTGGYTADHCPGASVEISNFKLLRDPEFRCDGAIAAFRHYAPTCDASRRDYAANDCDRILLSRTTAPRPEPLQCDAIGPQE